MPLIACQKERFGEDLVLPEPQGATGPKVVWRDAESAEDEGRWVADDVLRLIDRGANPATIAVLSNDKETRLLMRECLEKRGVPTSWYESGSNNALVDLDHPSVKVLTIASAKGLEFPVVFVPAVTEHLFPSKDNDSERADKARRLLYTAMTRAGRQLFVSATRSEQSQLWSELELTFLEGGDEGGN